VKLAAVVIADSPVDLGERKDVGFLILLPHSILKMKNLSKKKKFHFQDNLCNSWKRELVLRK